uniref:Uncharacterized protein n=1 Tax=Arion vulgaris TaxID=1028688 RepID=A0A0B7AAG6_9EUPU
MKILWHNTSNKTKLLRTCILFMATYGCESLAITQTLKNKIEAGTTKAKVAARHGTSYYLKFKSLVTLDI